jgi:regulator of sigma E protease
MSNILVTVLALILVLGVLIFVHELGHFLAAKWAGIRVFRFSLGMGTPIRRLTFTWKGTEYSVGWLPLGGYVKMASREEMAGDALEGGPANIPDVPHAETFEAQPIWKRMIVILAGVTMNVGFAWLVFAGLLYRNGRPVIPDTRVGRVAETGLPPGAEAMASLRPGDRITAVAGRPARVWGDVIEGIQHASPDTVVIEVEGRPSIVLRIHPDALDARLRASIAMEWYLAPVVGSVVAGRPAARAGIVDGDTLVAADGQPIGQWYDLVRILTVGAGAPVVLTVGGPDGRRDTPVTPDVETESGPGGVKRQVGRIGVYAKGPDVRYEPASVWEAVVGGGQATLVNTTFIVRTVRGMLTGRVSTREVGGPIAIGQLAGDAARQGLESLLLFMAVISVNLAVVNLLPIPVLDGGQFLFLLGEAILRRPLPLRLRQRLTTVGLVMISLLMVFAFSNDIRRLLGF